MCHCCCFFLLLLQLWLVWKHHHHHHQRRRAITTTSRSMLSELRPTRRHCQTYHDMDIAVILCYSSRASRLSFVNSVRVTWQTDNATPPSTPSPPLPPQPPLTGCTAVRSQRGRCFPSMATIWTRSSVAHNPVGLDNNYLLCTSSTVWNIICILYMNIIYGGSITD